MTVETSFRVSVGKNIAEMNESIAILYNFSNFRESSIYKFHHVLQSYMNGLHNTLERFSQEINFTVLFEFHFFNFLPKHQFFLAVKQWKIYFRNQCRCSKDIL